ncbi:MAG: PQQ-binding-like beta-propeller repeat protein [Halobacteria archaeon]
MVDRSRRKFLSLAGAAGLTGLAGCAGNTNRYNISDKTKKKLSSPVGGSDQGRHVSPSQMKSDSEFAESKNLGSQEWLELQYDSRNSGHTRDVDGPVKEVEERWHFYTGSKAEASPIVHDGVVYAGTSDNSTFFALDAATGKPKWIYPSYKKGKRTKNTDWFFTAPAFSKGKVITGNGNGKIYAFDAKTGDVDWTFKTKGGRMFCNVAAKDGVTYVGGTDTVMYAIDVESGTKKWSNKTGGWIFTKPAVVGDHVYYGSNDKKLYKVKKDSGDVVWTYKTKSKIPTGPTVVDGSVYIGTDLSFVVSVDAESGKKNWRKQTGTAKKKYHYPDGPGGTKVYNSLAVADGKVYCTTDRSGIHAFDAKSGKRVWSYKDKITKNDEAGFPPAIVNDTLYTGWRGPGTGGVNGKIYALDPKNGDVKWTFDKAGAGGPGIANGLLYFGSRNGNIYALEEK